MAAQAAWLSASPADVHAAQRFILLYSPVWMGAVACVVALGLFHHFSALGYVVFGAALALPCIAAPLFLPPSHAPFHTQHWCVCSQFPIDLSSR